MLNDKPKTKFMKSQAQIFHPMTLHPFHILYKVLTVKEVPGEVWCHKIVFQAASQRDINYLDTFSTD